MPGSLQFYGSLGAELCASVPGMLRNVTGNVSPFDPTCLRGTFGGIDVDVRRGPGVKTCVELRRDESSVVFRESRHMPGMKVVERCEESLGMIAVGALRRKETCEVLSLMAALGSTPNGDGDPHLFLMPEVRSGMFVFLLTDEPGLRSVDFCAMHEGRGYAATGIRRGDILQCDLDDDMRSLLRPRGLGRTTRIEVYGAFVSTMRAMAMGLKLVFLSGHETLDEFPRRMGRGVL